MRITTTKEDVRVAQLPPSGVPPLSSGWRSNHVGNRRVSKVGVVNSADCSNPNTKTDICGQRERRQFNVEPYAFLMNKKVWDNLA
jgi:hypothetical protein